MRRLTTLLFALLLAACSGVDTDRSLTSTTKPEAATTTTVPPSATSTMQVPSTTTTEAVDESDDGSESIGVTDKVTIVVTDPEDG